MSIFAVAPGYGVGGVLDALLETAGPAPAERGGDDAYWMRRALLSAMAAEGRASPNPTVGAVIVKDGVVIATGATEPWGGRHAERCAIDSVPDRSVLRGATIYTTLEPCAHWGKQPPCADLVASCGFARCVSGLRDPDPRVAGSGLARVRATGTEVCAGVLRNEVLAWHLPYLLGRISARPLVSTLASDGDGPALLLGRSAGWDEREPSRRYRGWLRAKPDLVVTAPSPASVDPVAFVRGPWRAMIWWAMDGCLDRMSVAEARDLAARAGDLGVPIALVCTPDREHRAVVEAYAAAGVTPIAQPAGATAAGWLATCFQGDDFAALTGKAPAWVLVDDHPRLAEALAAAQAIDVVHAVRAESPSPGGGPPPGDRLSPITRTAAADMMITEYYTQRLTSALGKTAW